MEVVVHDFAALREERDDQERINMKVGATISDLFAAIFGEYQYLLLVLYALNQEYVSGEALFEQAEDVLFSPGEGDRLHCR